MQNSLANFESLEKQTHIFGVCHCRILFFRNSRLDKMKLWGVVFGGGYQVVDE
jgi:hypothetical protein